MRPRPAEAEPSGDAPGLRTSATFERRWVRSLGHRPDTAVPVKRAAGRRLLSLRHTWFFVNSPLTRAHVRLLGPCFKTGRKVARKSSLTDGGTAGDPVVDGSCRRASRPGAPGFGAGRLRRSASAATNRHPGPSTGAQRVATSVDRTRNPAGRCRPTVNSPGGDSRALSVYTRTVSRSYELSLQSSFQLSLTVLVHYRSRGRI